MKVVARIFLIVGLLAILIGFGVLFVDFPDTNGLKDKLTYIFFESATRGLWVIGLIGLVIGYLLNKKVKKRNRIFY